MSLGRVNRYYKEIIHDSNVVFISQTTIAPHAISGSDGFHKVKKGNLGTHSIRKGAATFCRRMGVDECNVELRGRWKRSKATVRIYIDNSQPVPDALAAIALCGSGGCSRYMVRNDYSILQDDSFLLNVVPALQTVVGVPMAKLFATAILWVATRPFRDSDFIRLPLSIKLRVEGMVKNMLELPEDSVVPVVVTRIPQVLCSMTGDLILNDALPAHAAVANMDVENGPPDGEHNLVLDTTLTRGGVPEMQRMLSAVLAGQASLVRRTEELNVQSQHNLAQQMGEMAMQVPLPTLLLVFLNL